MCGNDRIALVKTRGLPETLRIELRMLNELPDGRVLIVDDTKTNIDILVAALRNECRISVATSGPTA